MRRPDRTKQIEPLLEAVVNGISWGDAENLHEQIQDVRTLDCSKTRVVIFGGGTGLSTVVGGNCQLDEWPDNPFLGLKQEFPHLDVVVCTTDDGRSTGRLLQHFPMVGIGDLRKLCLSMIREEHIQDSYNLSGKEALLFVQFVHALFNYRFPDGHHDFGPVLDPLLVVPRHLRSHCPEPLKKLLSKLGAYFVTLQDKVPGLITGGHCLGNLLITAAVFRASGKRGLSTPPGPEALQKGLDLVAGAIGATTGRLHPATATPGQLVFNYTNGVAVRGQEKSALSRRGFPVRQVAVDFCGQPRVSPELCSAIKRADVIIYAPGSLYTSIIPILQLQPIARAISGNRKALKVLAANFWIQAGETDISLRSRQRGFRASELVDAYGHNVPGGCSGLFDIVISANLQHVPGNIFRNYALEGKRPIYFDRDRILRMGLQPVEATIFSRQRLNFAGVIHHDPKKFSQAIRTLLYVHTQKDLKRKESAPPNVKPVSGPPVQTAGVLPCRYLAAIDQRLAAKNIRPKALRDILYELTWENRDIHPDHLDYFAGARIIADNRWNRSTEWDNILGYYDPEDRMLKINARLRDDPERLRENVLIALGESLLGRYLASRCWLPREESGWGARSYEVTLRPEAERDSYLSPEQLRTYLMLARMIPAPDNPRVFRITLNDDEGFLPPGLLFGLMYAWYLNNAYGEIMEYEMALLHWPKERLIPHQREERRRKEALIDFFRTVVFRHTP